MHYRIFILFILISYHSIGQSEFVFKEDIIQITFPRKPFLDTMTLAGGFKVRFIASKDSVSNYYLTIMERQTPDSQDNENLKHLGAYFDGVMDSMGERYKAETLSKNLVKVNSDSTAEYYMKGYYGTTPIYIKSWICVKGQKTIVCQHLYAVSNEAILRSKQQVFFQSIIF